MIVIGIDPDSKAHGVAIYHDGKLVSLHNWELMQLHMYVATLDEVPKFSIENVLANGFIYGRNQQANKALQGKVGMAVGKCQQAQTELMRMLDWHSIPYELHKPTKANFAKDAKRFADATGWEGRSNEDQRSAAYFGWLAIK